MLERIDIIIAFATVLLGVSLLITILNQMIASLLGHRATYLKDGIKDLLATLDPSLGPDLETIANDVLTNKLASDSIFVHQRWAPQRWKMASTIRPEELTKLLALVSKGKSYAATIDKVVNEINPMLKRDAGLIIGLAPGATADQLIRELSNSATKAIGRLEAGYSSTMDRVRQRFTLQMRIWTIIFAFIFAFVYHMDARKIYSQISTDPALRASVSSVSSDLIKTYTEVGTATENKPTSDQAKQDLDERTKKLSQAYTQVSNKLSDLDLALLDVPKHWWKWEWSEILGIVAMAALLSLGAPFWYNVLKNLVNLRSQVAQKQKEEETASQTL
jgi:hypothetical protein